jgi:hypothetical protein
MNDEVLTRFAERFATAAEPQAAESEQEENAGAFGFLRGARERALMLEFRLKDGRALALSYALLDQASFDPSDGIRLKFSGQEIRLAGRLLNERSGPSAPLFDAIVRHRVTWIKESSRAELLETRPNVLIVESISFSG